MTDLTAAAVALNMGVTRDWVYVLLKSCQLEGYQPTGPHGPWRVTPEALAAFKAGAKPIDPNRIAPRSARSIAALARRAA